MLDLKNISSFFHTSFYRELESIYLLFILKVNLLLFIYYYCYDDNVCMVSGNIWRSEDTFWKLILSLYGGIQEWNPGHQVGMIF